MNIKYNRSVRNNNDKNNENKITFPKVNNKSREKEIHIFTFQQNI